MSTPHSPRRYHRLKTWRPFFKALREERKTFEVRQNDRGFREGDFLVLEEYDEATRAYTGWYWVARVTYLLEGGAWGIAPGHVVMGLAFAQAGKDFTPARLPLATEVPPPSPSLSPAPSLR